MPALYEKWIEVEFFHDYFQMDDGSMIRAALIAEPTLRCAGVLKDRQLLFRGTPSGFRILYRAVKDAEGVLHPLVPPDEGMRMSFYLFANDPALGQFSDLPLAPGAGVYHLSNLVDNRRGYGNSPILETLLTRDNTTGYLGAGDFLPYSSKVFPVEYPSLAAQSNFEVLDGLQRVVSEKTLVPLEGVCRTGVDLTGREEGVYSIRVDGTVSRTFYVADEAFRRRPFGVVDLHLASIVKDDYALADEDLDLVPRTYTARIKNRETVWKYYVGLKYRKDTDPRDLSITYPNAQATFRPRDAETSLDGLRVIPFDTGDARLALKYQPIKGIRLNKGATHTPGILEVIDLPNPPPGNLRQQGDRIFSEIFIYV